MTTDVFRASKTWSVVGSLPYGMSLSSSGILSGTSAYDGNYVFNIQVTDGATTFTKRFSLVGVPVSTPLEVNDEIPGGSELQG